MKTPLKQAFDEAAKLPAEEQEALGRWIMEELAAERRWEDLFHRSPTQLSRLAQEARDEDRAGETKPLDPDRL
ncbi:MAG: hypothetical protein E8D45_04605 [Nitrospira sp.]|nr:MAG: hypothetical protein E8D45_04605 [Nitrospira sp.]